MNYVEALRVRNCLVRVAIILGILVVLAVILRISLARYMSPETWVSKVALDATTTTTKTTLPDGTRRTVLDDSADRTHIVIDDRGSAGKTISITEPSSHVHSDESHFSHVGNIISSESHGGTTTTVIKTNGSVPMIYYMAVADIAALIVATILAAPFAREIDGHLEVALTKPCTRLRYALGTIGFDAVGVLAASFLTIVALYLCQLLFETARVDATGVNARAIVMGIALPLAWYGMLCAATTWLNRSYAAVLGFAWPVVLLVSALSTLEPNNAVALVVHDTAWGISRLFPLSYVSFAQPDAHGALSYSGSDFGVRLAIEVLLLVVYAALAVWRWQRVEA
jgi:hypothetical protein